MRAQSTSIDGTRRWATTRGTWRQAVVREHLFQVEENQSAYTLPALSVLP